MIETRLPGDMPFIDRIKAEYLGVDIPDPEREKREREENLGVWIRIAAKYGEITERELASMPI